MEQMLRHLGAQCQRLMDASSVQRSAAARHCLQVCHIARHMPTATACGMIDA